MIDVVIVGAGVAGMTAAIYLKRAGIDALIIEKSAPGGQVNRTDAIENYPGFVTVSGPDLVSNMFLQIESLGIKYKSGEVIDIIDNKDYKTVVLENEKIDCKYVIIATGRFPKELGLENEKELIGKGISMCATCDGYFFRGKDVAVVGGGNSAAYEALHLSKICRSVKLIVRKDKMRAEKIYQDHLAKNPNIEILYNTEVKKLIQKNGILSQIEILEKGKSRTLDIDGLFISIGHEPKIDFLKSIKLRKSKNYIVVNRNMETSIDGIYACGDCIKKDLYQIVVSAGEGALVASKIIERL